jgi:sugar lactone lactonase YvrE
MQSFEAKVAFRRASDLGEGSLWDVADQRLYWVDIVQRKVMAFDPKNGSNLEYDVGQSVGTVVVAEHGKLLLGLRQGVSALDLATGEVRVLAAPESDKPGNRLNDGKCDPSGRFWVGSMVEDGNKRNGALYCFDGAFRCERKLDGVDCSNGLVWSRDGRRFYYIDTPTQVVRAFDFEPASAALRGERVVAHFDTSLGSPDGMAIDEHDQLWVAMWGGGKVLRIDPKSGAIGMELALPAVNVTSCAFGGPELNRLYVTTARVGQSADALKEKPDTGSLFFADLPVRGVPATRFAGDI